MKTMHYMMILFGVSLGFWCSALIMRIPAYQSKSVIIWFEHASMGQPSADVEGLKKMGKIAVPELSAELRSDRVERRLKAAWILGQMGSKAAGGAIPALDQAIDDPDQMVRTYALRALSALGFFQESMVPKLIEKLGDSHESVSDSASGLLLKIEEQQEHNHVPVWTNEYAFVMAFLQSPSRRVQLVGLEKLAGLPEGQMMSAKKAIMAGNDKWLQQEVTIRLVQRVQQRAHNPGSPPPTNTVPSSPYS